MPVADEPDRHRALPWRGEPRAGGTPPRARCAITGFNVVIISQWTDPRETERGIAWCRDTYAALTPYLGADALRELPRQRRGEDPAAVAYGPNYARLRELKTKYDPDNFFHRT